MGVSSSPIDGIRQAVHTLFLKKPKPSRKRPSKVAALAGGVLISSLLGPIAYVGLSQQLASAADVNVTGLAFRDFDQDGERSSTEPPIENLWVVAYGQEDGFDNTLNTNDDVFNSSNPVLTDAYGQYSATVPSDSGVRVEFLGLDTNLNAVYNAGTESVLPSWLRSGIHGSDNGSSVQIVTSSGNSSTANYAVANPADYSGISPGLAVTKFTNGLPSNGGGAVYTLPWYSGFGTSGNQVTDTTQVGSVYGAAYDRSAGQLLVGAFLKRHVGMGPLGPGGLYALNSGGGLAWSLDLSTRGVDAGAVNSNAIRGLGAIGDPSSDPTAFAAVGHVGLGDLAVGEDDSSLWFTSLADNQLYRLALNGGAMPSGNAQIVAGMPGACDSPFAVTPKDGKIYVGKICVDASGYEVVAYDVASNTWSTPVPKSALQPRGCVFNTYGCSWYGWTNSWPTAEGNGSTVVYPQPILSDIAFDNNGSMVLTFGDRWGHQTGYQNLTPDGISTVTGMAAGDTLRLCVSGNAYSPCYLAGNDWYIGADPNGAGHGETAQGGAAIMPGDTRYAMTQMDGTAAFTGDVSWFTHIMTTTPPYSTPVNPGEQIRLADPSYAFKWGVQMYNQSSPGGFGKASGLGDLELLGDTAPIEIGNRVWLDSNSDGRQDPAEAGIAGVVVKLFQGASEVGTTTTSSDGRYWFNDTNVPGGVQPQTQYSVSIAHSQPALAGVQTTVANAPSGANDATSEDSDSNGIYSGSTSITSATVTTGLYGSHNHTIDFGYTPQIYSVGNFLWIDQGAGTNLRNGAYDPDEVPVVGASVSIYAWANGGIPLGSPIASTSTNSEGYYRFDYLAPGEYVIVVDSSNFASGVLVGYTSSPGVRTQNDGDNGEDAFVPSGPAAGGVRSQLVLLGGTSPTNDSDARATTEPGDHGPGGDTKDDLTVDFGFSTPTISTTTTTPIATTTTTIPPTSTTTTSTTTTSTTTTTVDPTTTTTTSTTTTTTIDPTTTTTTTPPTTTTTTLPPTTTTTTTTTPPTTTTTTLPTTTTSTTTTTTTTTTTPPTTTTTSTTSTTVPPTTTTVPPTTTTTSTTTTSTTTSSTTTAPPTTSAPSTTVPPVYDLALVKVLSEAPSQANGYVAKFSITVKNQGNVTSGAYTVQDASPLGLTVDPASLTDGATTIGTITTWTLTGLAPGATKTLPISVTSPPNNSSSPLVYLNWAEIVADSGADVDSTPNTNIGQDVLGPDDLVSDRLATSDVHNDLDAGNTPSSTATDEDDNDLAAFVVPAASSPTTFDLALRKTLAASQVNPVPAGADVVFALQVFNQGGAAAKDVQLVDYVPAGFSYTAADNSTGWTSTDCVGPCELRYTMTYPLPPGSSTTMFLRLKVAANATSATDLRNYAEIYSADDTDPATAQLPVDIDSTPDANPSNDGVALNDITDQDHKSSSAQDEDDHDYAEVMLSVPVPQDVFDLALRKTTGASLVSPGTDVTFDIDLFNQGSIDATNITIVDYVPNGFNYVAAANPFWSSSDCVGPCIVTRTISRLDASLNTGVSLILHVRNDATVAFDFRNFAEISSADDNDPLTGQVPVDRDSTPDSVFGNDGAALDDIILQDRKADPAADEDDHDFAEITLQTNTGPSGPTTTTIPSSSPTTSTSTTTTTLTPTTVATTTTSTSTTTPPVPTTAVTTLVTTSTGPVATTQAPTTTRPGTTIPNTIGLATTVPASIGPTSSTFAPSPTSVITVPAPTSTFAPPTGTPTSIGTSSTSTPPSTNPTGTPKAPTTVPSNTTVGTPTTIAGSVGTPPTTGPVPTGSVECLVWLDRNGDGKVSASEAGVAGAVVIVRSDTGEQRLTTDSKGVCRLENLVSGQYEIEVVAKTSPSNGPRVRQFSVGSTVTALNFGFSTTGVRGIQIEQPATSSQSADFQPSSTPNNGVLAFTGAQSLILLAVSLMIIGIGGLLSTRRRRHSGR